jgi:hypothetical protein
MVKVAGCAPVTESVPTLRRMLQVFGGSRQSGAPRPHRFDRLRKVVQPVAAGDQHIAHPAVTQLGEQPSQNLAPSVDCIQMPSMCFVPSVSTPTTRWAALFTTYAQSRTFTTNASM